MSQTPILTIDICNSKIVSTIAKNNINNDIEILGVGHCKANGISKGKIINMDLAAVSIKRSLDTMNTIGSVMTMLNDKIDPLTKIIFGTTVDKKIEKDEVSIMLIATGFEVQEPSKPPIQPEPTNNGVIEEDSYYDIPPLMRNYNIRCVVN